jgi:hypothetical protein
VPVRRVFAGCSGPSRRSEPALATLASRVSDDEATVAGLSSKPDAQIADLQDKNDTPSLTVLATSASLASLNDNLNRILNLLQNGQPNPHNKSVSAIDPDRTRKF